MPRWTSRVLLSVGVMGLLLALGVLYVISRDSATPVEVADAVGRYREETASTTTSLAPAGPVLPEPGVYVYATEGTEQVDILGGATHTYPAETAVTIARIECGIQQRWTPIEERWDDEELCRTEAGFERRTLRTHHQFFGITDDQLLTCEAGYVTLPADPVPGATWPTDCRSSVTHVTGTATVVGFEVRDVAGVPVETVHVRVEEQTSGSSRGEASDDYWLRRSDGLLVERSSSVSTESDTPVGTASYQELFVLRLTSLTPRT